MTTPMTLQGVEQPPPAVARRGRAGTWARVLLACAVLLGSAAVRTVQARRTEVSLEEGLKRFRFDLETIPKTIGPWKGQDTRLDPRIARATGAEKVITRRYVDTNTGTTVELILLYGPAADMYTHIAEVCYPAAGYARAGDVATREVTAGPYRAPFRSLVFTKGEGSQADFQEVYYSWRRPSGWTPDLGTQKQFERIPGMYKVQLARRVTERERRDVGNPCEAFLREFLPQMERRIAPPPVPAEGQGDRPASLPSGKVTSP